MDRVLVIGLLAFFGGSLPAQQFAELARLDLPVERRPGQSVAAGDLDGDGLPELVFGHHLEPTIVYRNNGLRFEEASRPLDADSARVLELIDLDGDGHLDLVVGNALVLTGDVRLYFNDGTGTLTERYPRLFAPDGKPIRDLALADLDADGVVGPADLRRLLGSWHSPVASDIDGDGFLDIHDSNALQFFWGQSVPVE